MKNTILLFLSLCSISLALNAEIIEFDGKSSAEVDIKSFLLEYLPNAPSIPGRLNDAASPSSLRIGVLNEEGVFIEAQPDKNWFNEEGVREDHYTFLPGIKIWEAVTCNWRDSRPWSAEVNYSYTHDTYGGHFHYEPLPPALNISRNYGNTPPDNAFVATPSPISVPVTPNQTPYKFWIKLPEFATRIKFLTQSYGSCENQYKSAVIDVKYTYGEKKDLQAMPKGKNYILYNSTTAASYHHDSHYGTKEFIDTLTSIADEYRAACPKAKPLYINDMSLPWGGKFDLNRKWMTGSHYTHKTGINADVSKKLVRKANRVKLLEIMCKKTAGAEVYSEGDDSDEAPHYHLGPKDDPKDSGGAADSNYKIIKCCPVPNPIPDNWGCVKLESNGTDYEEVELPENPSDCK